MAETIKIGGELESMATGGVVAAASAVKDKVKNKTQGEINAETDAILASHEVAINGLNSQTYETVTATDQTTDVTDVLPATGDDGTVYRVGNWDGTQFDESSYSEYSWSNTNNEYVHISTKTQIGEVFDISAYHASGGELATYDDLNDALGEDGANIPDPLKRGGMSVKFVKTSDNNYVQWRYMSTSTADADFANVANWQGVDDKPTAGSDNLVKSGGVYENDKIYDSLITQIESPNLFDKTAATLYKYVRKEDGQLSSYDSTFTSDFIPIDSAGCYAKLGKTGGSHFGYACYSVKSIDSFTHGDNSKQAQFQEGDAYVRYSGDLVNIDEFMVVRGTSSDYPDVYFGYGNIGKLRPDTVSTEQIKDGSITVDKIVNGSITVDKLATESVNAEKLSDINIWIRDDAPYRNTIKETYFIPEALIGIAIITIRYTTGGRIIVSGLDIGKSVIWKSDKEVSTYENGVIYNIICNTTASQYVSNGDIIGYIVFSDFSSFISHEETSNNERTYINLSRAKFLLNNPTIATQTYRVKDNEIDTVKIKNNAITVDKIADESVNLNKTTFSAVTVSSVNLLNTSDQNYMYGNGYYISYNTGNADYSAMATYAYGYTGFIPVSTKGLYFNAYVKRGYYGGAVYDKDKHYIRRANNPYTYVEGDAYVRWTIAENPISPYTEGQYMVWEGTTASMPDYDEYHEKQIISPDVLPKTEVVIQNGSIIKAKLSDDVKHNIIGMDVDICISDIIPCVVNDTIRIYFRSIVKSPNPYIWDITAVSSAGRSFPRYYEYTPESVVNNQVTFYVKNSNGDIAKQKTIIIKSINPITSPSVNKNILVVGASLTADGTITHELNRRLTSITGDGTPYNPTGLGLTNITFVGRKTGTSYTDIHQEGNSGWSWKDYSTIGRYAYRFFVVNQVGINIQPGAIYSGDGTLKFTVSATDIDIDAETGTGYFTCEYTGSGTQPTSGSLTKVSGEGDFTITYDSFNLDSGNPFWNDANSELDFITYANNYCNGSIDVLISYILMNDLTSTTEETLSTRIDTYTKPFIRAFHEQFPNSIFILCTMYLGSVSGGMAISYGASNSWNYYVTARKIWKWSELIRELAADDEFSPYVKIIETNALFDVENLYPVSNRIVANRSESTEVIQTNGVHPTANGKKTIADGTYEGLNMILQQT